MGKVKKGKELPDIVVQGQLSIFDIDVTEFNKKVIETEAKITNSSVNLTENKNDNTKKSVKLSTQQKEFLNKNMILENENLNRVIIYACGHMGIELKESTVVKTSMYDREGKLVAGFDKEINVIALDKIYYSSIKYELTDIQLKRLEELKSKFKSYKFIKRFGDRNIIVLHENRVSSINPMGWVLDYVSINNIEYTTEDVLEEKLEFKEEHKETCENIEYKIGDKILVDMLTRKVTGEVAHIYNSGESICFVYDNKYTATHISRIKKIA